MSNITFIQFEFKDGTNLKLTPQIYDNLSFELKNNFNIALSKAKDEVDEKRKLHKNENFGFDLGISVDDSIKSKDLGPAQAMLVSEVDRLSVQFEKFLVSTYDQNSNITKILKIKSNEYKNSIIDYIEYARVMQNIAKSINKKLKYSEFLEREILQNEKN